jgi:hypothetical protein
MSTDGVWFNWYYGEGGHPDGFDGVRLSQCERRMRLLIDLELPFYQEKRKELRESLRKSRGHWEEYAR